MKRKIIRIDESKCTGCELCIPNCPEGALQVIDGKARLISDLFCDGLGACLGQCPEGAISIEEREAAPYDERKVIAGIVRQGQRVTEAHLKHLRDHGEEAYLKEAMEYLREQGMNAGSRPASRVAAAGLVPGGCPGSRTVTFSAVGDVLATAKSGAAPSRLTHWPIQLHLISPHAPHFQGSDLLLGADCVSYATANFHEEHLKGRTLAIACPKLDHDQDSYFEKLTCLIRDADVKSITVMIMQVPCCAGLLHLTRRAVEQSGRKLPVRFLVVGLRGEILQEGSV